jgi:hypothetical protein
MPLFLEVTCENYGFNLKLILKALKSSSKLVETQCTSLTCILKFGRYSIHSWKSFYLVTYQVIFIVSRTIFPPFKIVNCFGFASRFDFSIYL